MCNGNLNVDNQQQEQQEEQHRIQEVVRINAQQNQNANQQDHEAIHQAQANPVFNQNVVEQGQAVQERWYKEILNRPIEEDTDEYRRKKAYIKSICKADIREMNFDTLIKWARTSVQVYTGSDEFKDLVASAAVVHSLVQNGYAQGADLAAAIDRMIRLADGYTASHKPMLGFKWTYSGANRLAFSAALKGEALYDELLKVRQPEEKRESVMPYLKKLYGKHIPAKIKMGSAETKLDEEAYESDNLFRKSANGQQQNYCPLGDWGDNALVKLGIYKSYFARVRGPQAAALSPLVDELYLKMSDLIRCMDQGANRDWPKDGLTKLQEAYKNYTAVADTIPDEDMDASAYRFTTVFYYQIIKYGQMIENTVYYAGTKRTEPAAKELDKKLTDILDVHKIIIPDRQRRDQICRDASAADLMAQVIAAFCASETLGETLSDENSVKKAYGLIQDAYTEAMTSKGAGYMIECMYYTYALQHEYAKKMIRTIKAMKKQGQDAYDENRYRLTFSRDVMIYRALAQIISFTGHNNVLTEHMLKAPEFGDAILDELAILLPNASILDPESYITKIQNAGYDDLVLEASLLQQTRTRFLTDQISGELPEIMSVIRERENRQRELYGRSHQITGESQEP